MKFVLVMWALGYPLVCYFGRYMNAKAFAIENRTPPTLGALALNEFLQCLAWIIGCLVILKK